MEPTVPQTLLSQISTILGTVTGAAFGAWAGARFAFSYGLKAKEQEKRRRQIAAVNQAMFTIMRQANFVRAFQIAYIDPLEGECPALEMKPSVDSEYGDLSFDYTGLSFLLETEHRSVMVHLYEESQLFEQAQMAARDRSRFHLEVIQPALMAAGVSPGVGAPKSDFVAGMGEFNFGLLENKTAMLIELVRDSVTGLERLREELIEAAHALFPDDKAKFIRFDLKK